MRVRTVCVRGQGGTFFLALVALVALVEEERFLPVALVALVVVEEERFLLALVLLVPPSFCGSANSDTSGVELSAVSAGDGDVPAV